MRGRVKGVPGRAKRAEAPEGRRSDRERAPCAAAKRGVLKQLYAAVCEKLKRDGGATAAEQDDRVDVSGRMGFRDGRREMGKQASQTVSVGRDEGDGSRFHHGCQQRIKRCGRAACHASRGKSTKLLPCCNEQLRASMTSSALATACLLPRAMRLALNSTCLYWGL
jgi:hypothetical protein